MAAEAMMFSDEGPHGNPAERALALQELLVTRATGGTAQDCDYQELRRSFMEHADTRDLLPAFVRTSRTLGRDPST